MLFSKVKFWLYTAILFSVFLVEALWYKKRIIDDSFTLFLTLVAGIVVLLPLIFNELEIIETNRKRKNANYSVYKIQARENNKGIDIDLERKLDELNNNNKIIVLIQKTEAIGYDDHRKDVYIIYK